MGRSTQTQLGLSPSVDGGEEGFARNRRTRTAGALACMVNAEVGAVLSVMRRNARWAGRYISGDEPMEHPLIRNLKSLRRKIFTWESAEPGWHSVNPSVYLSPFLDVIRSDETGAPITGVALSAVYKILTLEVIDVKTVAVEAAIHGIVDAVTSCRFEVTDPDSEEVVLMKILQVLLACMKCRAGIVLSNKDVCVVVNTCFRVVHQAGTKGQLLQRTARHTMHELVRRIFSHLPDLDPMPPAPGSTMDGTENGSSDADPHRISVEEKARSQANASTSNGGPADTGRAEDGGYKESERTEGDLQVEGATPRKPPRPPSREKMAVVVASKGDHDKQFKDGSPALEPYGVPCMVEIFHFLCSLLNITDPGGPGNSLLAGDEEVPLFALGLINSAVELGGRSFGSHPRLLALVQDELFRNLMQMGLSFSPPVLSMVCSIVLNLYHHLNSSLKLQIEAFFVYVIIRLAQGKYGASYQQQEVAMEALVDFCRQPTFMAEMYANFDCDIICSNVFEDIGNLLSKSAFPVNCPLSAMHVLALEGLLAVIHSMADRIDSLPVSPHQEMVNYSDAPEFVPFWTLKCPSYADPICWVDFVRRQKYIKRRLMIGADHFNRDPKKGLEFLQGIRLLPRNLDPKSVACFFRYTTGLDKRLLGDFLGDHDEFCVQVLQELAKTFDFNDMNLDAALRTFLESFRLPGEAQKIQRVLEAFAQRYYEQSPMVFVNEDAAFTLAYSIIILNTDLHNPQVKRKMTEEDFIRNNRGINGKQDLPREMLAELYHSIARNEIRISYDNGAGVPEMTHSRWVDLMRRSRSSTPYISCDSRPLLDHDMFAIISGPTIAAISVVFDNAEDEEVLRSCVDGFLAVAKISASHWLEDVLDDLVVSLCKFTTLLNPMGGGEEPVMVFGDDTKARMAAVTVFTIANKWGDYIRTGWRNILDCILRLHKLGLLPARVASDAAEDADAGGDSAHGRVTAGSLSLTVMPSVGARRRPTGLMSRFSQFLSLDVDEPRAQPTEQQLAAHQKTLRTIEACHIDNIFSDSKFLQAESLLQLARALIWAAGRPHKGGSSPEDEDTAVFCLELLIAITLNNRDRIMLLWQMVYEHMAGIVQTSMVPGLLVEKAVFGLLRICQRLLPYKEDLAEELLRSLQLLLKLDARVAEAFCERITMEVMQLVKANAGHIKSPMGWRTVSSLLASTVRHPDAFGPGFETLSFIMTDGAHLTPANYVLCLDAARAFAESRVGGIEKSIRALDLLAESVNCLVQWAATSSSESMEESDNTNSKPVTRDDAVLDTQSLGEMWLRLAQVLRRLCGDPREDVRNHAILCLQRCLSGVENIRLPPTIWTPCFDQVIFVMLDDLLDVSLKHSPKDYRGMEGTLLHAMKFLSKIFLQYLDQLSQLPSFRPMWLTVLSRMEMYIHARIRGKTSDKLQEGVPELLKNMLLIMHNRGVLVQRSTLGGDSLWELTWHHVEGISPTLQQELFPEQETDHQEGDSSVPDVGNVPPVEADGEEDAQKENDQIPDEKQ
ncbi:hypothetical protein R1sor_006839 [Riccia sorocarpa]|uniref:SEC7 domain-containing protein n=1 Tax=Riccia sorocarpa TaxID=122646 RepID=A0ABD3HP30_9MARC